MAGRVTNQSTIASDSATADACPQYIGALVGGELVVVAEVKFCITGKNHTKCFLMRRTILVNHLMEPPHKMTGVTRYVFCLLGELIKRSNFDYVLLTNWKKENLPQFLATNDLKVESCTYVESTPLNLVHQLWLVPVMFRRYGCVAELNCGPLGCFLPSWPRVITVHDLYMRTLPSLYALHHRLWWNLFFPPTAGASQPIVCVSHATHASLSSYYPRLAKKAVVVHEAGALPMTNQETPAGLSPPFGVFVGNISPNKNIGLLLDAMKIAEERGKPVPIRFVGRDDAGLLARAGSVRALKQAFLVLGSISDLELSRVYHAARFLVTTSKQEGFCLPVLEAQERGVPVICPDIPIFREVAGEGALYFSLDAADELADRLVQIMEDDRLYKNLSCVAKRNAARFSWAKAAEQIEKILSAAIGKRR